MKLFPFRVYDVSRNADWFNKFYAAHREEIVSEHGSYYYSGNAIEDRKKQFSYYEASAEFESPTKVTVTFYRMESMTYGGRGEAICSITGTVEVDDSIRSIIERRMQNLAEYEYDDREEKRLALLRKKAIAELKTKLFADFKY